MTAGVLLVSAGVSREQSQTARILEEEVAFASLCTH